MLLAADSSDPSQLTGLAGWVVDVIGALGYAGVAFLVALENLFPPIPSEVVMPVAGLLAGQGEFALPLVVLAATVGSVVGAVTLYEGGRVLGRDRIARLADRLPLVEVDDLERAEEWFARHGGSAVLIGRLVPVVRSLISVPAGVERMPLARFTLFTALGSGAYNTVLVGLGYVLGSRWTTIGEYSSVINYVVYAGIVLAVVVPLVRRARSRRRG